MDLLGLFFVFRGGEGGGVAAVDSLGNEPSALGVPFILEVIDLDSNKAFRRRERKISKTK